MLSRRSAIVLVVVTLAAVAAAAVVMLGDRGRHRQADRSTLFPGIEQEFNRISRIEIADKDGAVIIARSGEGSSADQEWVLPEKHGYPADRAAVRRLILAFARMEVIEAKTRQPAFYERLGLRDLAAGDSRARRVTLWSGAEPVASILIGDRAASHAPGGNTTGAERAYLRRSGEAETWLADNVPEVAAKASEWLDDRLFSLPKERIAEIIIRHDNGEELRLSRADADVEFTLDQLPKGRSLKAYGGAEALASALAFLAFDDVRPAGQDDEPETARATFTTFDGLAVTVGVQGNWAHFSAAGEDPEVDDISGRLGRWRYALPDYKIRDLSPMLEQLLASENAEQAS